jgi:hypothetical protein
LIPFASSIQPQFLEMGPNNPAIGPAIQARQLGNWAIGQWDPQ